MKNVTFSSVTRLTDSATGTSKIFCAGNNKSIKELEGDKEKRYEAPTSYS